ncbi:MAG: polysaccharide deacetylase family protein [Anaerolineae bacterium]|nr:polysaccharide deacetylase family protein [Anaerolineae bacterium]
MDTLKIGLAQVLSLSGSYSPFQSLLARLYGGFILAFHNLEPERFIQQIEALKPNQPISLSDLISRAANNESTAGCFAITFDDGVGETVRAITQVAVKHNWPVTFFLPTDYLDNPTQGMIFQWWRCLEPYLPSTKIHLPDVGNIDLSNNIKMREFKRHVKHLIDTKRRNETEPLIWGLVDFLTKNEYVKEEWLKPPAPITWEEVSQISTYSVIQFESHGISHSPVSSLSPEQLEQELVASKQKISDATGYPCKHFCYPFGGQRSIGDLAPKIVAKYYQSGVTMHRGRVGRPKSLYSLPRIPLYPRDDASMARLKTITV